MLVTEITRRFGIAHPIIQAGMSQEAGAALAAAVSNAGGLGTIGSIGRSPEGLAAEITACRAATRRPFSANVVTFEWAPFAGKLLDVAIEMRVPVLTLSFGTTPAQIERCKASGVTVMVQVQDMAGARAALGANPDALIVQGTEAGGHTGRRGTLSFAAQVLDLAGATPVVVAGGIATGRGVAAALAMGASAAVLGTRFKASDEFGGPALLKDAIVASEGSDTYYGDIIDIPFPFKWPAGIAGRVLANRYTADWHGREDDLRRAVTAAGEPGAFLGSLQAPDTMLNWAGESSGLVARVMPAAEIVAEVMAEAERLLKAAARVVQA